MFKWLKRLYSCNRVRRIITKPECNIYRMVKINNTTLAPKSINQESRLVCSPFLITSKKFLHPKGFKPLILGTENLTAHEIYLSLNNKPMCPGCVSSIKKFV